jgi:hypothetical protein
MFSFFKKSLDQAVTDLIVAAEASPEPRALMKKAEAVASRAPRAKPEERQAALERLAGLLEDAPLPVAGCTALTCGGLVEMGADPRTALAAVLRHAQEALTLAKTFAAECQQAAEAAGKPEGEEGEENADPVGRFGQQVAERKPREAFAFMMLEPLCLASIAMLSRSKPARKAARRDPALRELAGELAPYHGRADFLWKMLRVLDDEELVVLLPGVRLGYRVQIAGIADNFQLHVLLADALMGPPEQGLLPGNKPDPAVVAAFRDGPPSGRQTAEGVFNLFNWQALLPDLALPEGFSDSKYWVWNEGVPDDIALFEEQRIVLVGKPPYHRTWNACRIFDGMKGELAVVEQLTPAVLEDWLKRLAAAAPQPPPSGA